MDSAGIGLELTDQFLRSSLGFVNGVPQLRLHLNTTLKTIDRTQKKTAKFDQETSGTCSYCYSSGDLNTDEFSLENVSKSQVSLNRKCHLCKRVSEQKIVFSKLPKPELKVHCETESKKPSSKKKKNKKDLTAGLTIPTSLSTPLKKRTSGNKDKLKHLLAKDSERIKKKTSLQDFLQNVEDT